MQGEVNVFKPVIDGRLRMDRAKRGHSVIRDKVEIAYIHNKIIHAGVLSQVNLYNRLYNRRA